MGIIVHKCADCGHNDVHHKNLRGDLGACSIGRCVHGPHAFRPEPPHVAPTFGLDGRVIERVVEPGGKTPGPGPQARIENLCACEECWALYSEVGAVRHGGETS